LGADLPRRHLRAAPGDGLDRSGGAALLFGLTLLNEFTTSSLLRQANAPP
jgi:hypothetical protein